MRYTHEERMPDLALSIGRLASGRLCSPTPTQYAVKPALEGDRSFLDEFMREIKERRDFVVASVKRSKELSCDEPSAAFYVMIKAAVPIARTDEAFVRDLLEQEGVFVVPGSGFGVSPTEGLFRLVYLADKDVLGDVFTRIDRFLIRTRLETKQGDVTQRRKGGKDAKKNMY